MSLRKEKRKELNQPTKRYLRNGGKITVLKGTEFKPRPKRSTAESNGTPYVAHYLVLRLVDWCNKGSPKNPRRRLLSEITGIPNTITPRTNARLPHSEYRKYKAAMPKVEAMEQGMEKFAA